MPLQTSFWLRPRVSNRSATMLAMITVGCLGCATPSGLSYDETVDRIRRMCDSHEVVTINDSVSERPVFEIKEEVATDGKRWEIAFIEGRPCV